jgi:hypothetical protein
LLLASLCALSCAAHRVTSIDSRTILDTQGADQLIGRDLLYTNGNDVVYSALY